MKERGEGDFIDDDQCAAVLREELRQIRKGRGLADFALPDYPLLRFIADNDNIKLILMISQMTEGELVADWRTSMRYALNCPVIGQVDLTERRARLADTLDVSFRTVTRWEDDAIDSLSLMLLASLHERWAEPGKADEFHKVMLQLRRETMVEQADLPSIIRRHGQVIRDVKRTMTKLNQQVAEMESLNEALSQMMGL